MKWLTRMQSCIEYIESNLHEEIDMKELCKIACLTKLYFFRMFEAASGITVREYIRRRRMSLAACEVVENRRIIDIAVEFGYSSHEAFSRAFKDIHGISPSEARKNDYQLKAYPPLSFKVIIKGDAEMNYEIKKKDAFRVLGKVFKETDDWGRGGKGVSEIWSIVQADGTLNELLGLADSQTDANVYGVLRNYLGNVNDKYIFEYIVAVPYTGDGAEGYEVIEIPAASWAVFKSVGSMPDAKVDMWNKIFCEWLPATQYEIAQFAPIDCFKPGDTTDSDYISEIWIPIETK